MFLDGHLHVEAGELAQVAMGVGILGAKHRANLEHALEIRLDRHLLVQLRRLRETRGLAHVIQLEHGRAALGRAADELRGVNLDEILRASASRKSSHTALCTRKMAWLAGVRRSITRWFNRVS